MQESGSHHRDPAERQEAERHSVLRKWEAASATAAAAAAAPVGFFW